MLSPSSNASLVPDAYQGYRKEVDPFLILNGGLFDTIADLADSPQVSEACDIVERFKGSIVSLESVFHFCINGPVASSHGQSTWDMLWRTMIANRASSLANLPVAADYFTHYILQVLAMYKANFKADELYTRTLHRLQ